MVMSGIGMSHYSFENCLESCVPAVRKKIRKIVKHKVHDYTFEFRCYSCQSCGEIMDKPYLYIQYDDDQTYETRFRCTKCRSRRLLPIEEEVLSALPCPSCKEITLTEVGMMLWD
ncbi:hypothetical protein [Salisediminibacterium selenitireducens]|nr:hypothetical protein [Salisediminibacterium selenitireducens]